MSHPPEIHLPLSVADVLTSRGRILVVDDDPVLLELSRQLLVGAGYAVSGAESGARCRAAVAVAKPDLILLDLNLPDISGLELCRQLKADPATADISVVHLSGDRISSEEQARGLDAGADGYIVRPVSNHELISRVEAALRVRRIERELRWVSEELEQTSRIMRQMMDHSLDIICSIDFAGAFVAVSAAVERMWGYPRHDLIGRCWLEFIHPDDLATSHAEVLAIRAGRHTRDFVNRCLRRDGSVCHVMWSAFWSEPEQRMFCVGRDVTEQRAREQALEKLDQRLARTLESMTDAFFTLDRDWHFTFLNREAARLLQRLPGELLGRNVWEEIPGSAETDVFPALVRSLAENRPAHLEFFYPPFAQWFEVHAFPNEEGMAVYFRDASERKRSEALLRESHERFLNVIRATEQTVWDWDLINRVIWWGGDYETYFGSDPRRSDPEARLWYQHIHPDDRERVRGGLLAAIEGGEQAWSDDYRLRRADGGYAWVHDRGFIMRDAEGRPVRSVGAITDITGRKQTEAQALRVQRMETIGTLAGGIAHDLNNVFSPILMSIELLKMKAGGDADSLNVLETIEDSGRHGADLVKQVLGFARGVQGERLTVQPRHLLKDIEKIITDTFPKNIQLRVAIEPGLRGVLGDPTQLHQVLLNLCLNARDAMANGGRITIQAENAEIDENFAAMTHDARSGPYVVIEVRDTGDGIAPGVLEKIFDPFFTTKEVGQGTGLGLSTALAITRSHGGFLRVSSEPGKGASFKVHLPVLVESLPEAADEGAGKLPRGAGELILLVDDEASIRNVTRHTLENFGYRVIVASDGAEAVGLFARHQSEIALVLTDMMMPVMDGPATIHVLNRMRPDVKIIAASGMTAADAPAVRSLPNVRHFLPKPYTAEAMLRAFSACLSPTSLTA